MSTNAAIIVPSDISMMIREIDLAYNRYLTEFRIPDDHKIIVNFLPVKTARQQRQLHIIFSVSAYKT